MEYTTTSVKGEPLQCKIAFDGFLRPNIDYLQKLTSNDWDCVGLVVGSEGDGKTRFTVQLAYYLDPKFNIDKVVFNADQFDEAVEAAPPESCIVWDEADDLTANWADAMLLAVKRKMKRIRMKRLYIFLVTPTFHDINKYFAITRTRFLIHVYSKGLRRGYFRFFDRNKKRKLYIDGKKYMDLNASMPNFTGSFEDIRKGFPIDMSADGEYVRKKDAATKELLDNKMTAKSAVKQYRQSIISSVEALLAVKGTSATRKELADALNVTRETIQHDLRDLRRT